MKRLISFFIFALPLAAQTPVQSPVGVKSQTAVVSQVLSGEVSGHTNFVGVSYCENGCAVNPSGDLLTITTSNNDACTSQKSSIISNISYSIWSCPVSSASTTVTATVTGFKTGDFIHSAISISEWAALPTVFVLANNSTCTGFTVANPFNGSSETLYGTTNPPACNGQFIFILPTAPPPPPASQSVNLTVSGNLSFDDGTPVTGTVEISQVTVIPTGGSENNILGTFVPDGTGNISGTVSLLTNFQDTCDFNFYLFDATQKQVGFMQTEIPGMTFKMVHSITGFKIVVLKSSCATTCTLGPGSTMGTLGP